MHTASNTGEPRITRLVASKRRPDYVNIYVDEEFALQVAMDSVVQHRLGKDMPWTSDLQQLLQKQKQSLKVRSLALSYATYKMRTEEQVRRRLQQRGYDPEEIRDALSFLLEFDYLNDQNYAQMFVRDRLVMKKVSARGLVRELRKRGIAAELAEKTVAELYPHDQSTELALAAAQRKMNSLTRRSPEKQKSALTSFLQRQGFSWSVIRSVVAQCLSSEESGSEEFDAESGE